MRLKDFCTGQGRGLQESKCPSTNQSLCCISHQSLAAEQPLNRWGGVDIVQIASAEAVGVGGKSRDMTPGS